MTKNTRLELTWVGKENRPQLEPRILLEDPALSYHAPHRVTETDQFDNLLIQGDNLLALKALEANYTGQVKCVFIDPPYNTGSAFTHYDDGVEHSLWLSLMRDRLEIIRKLLSEDGSLWITLDDNEVFYAKVLCDEIFGRSNFISSIAWNSRKSKQNDTQISLGHNFILFYSKEKDKMRLNRMPTNDEKFANPDADPNGPWTADPFDAPNVRPNLTYPILNPNTNVEYWPPQGRCWRTTPAEYEKYAAAGMVIFGKTGKSKPQLKRYLSSASEKGETPGTWWDDVGTATEATKEIQGLFGIKNFDTPKPERLLHRILTLATNPGDLVLDSFAGSGTTGAVAQKMGRRWIMVELGEHAKTHIVPRLRKVLDGQDPGGITKAVGWPGGGGFRFYNLAPSLLQEDRWGNLVINKQYDAVMLSEALCKLEGFRYAPSPEVYWQQGQSTETDYLFVTTATLTDPQLQQLSEEVGPERTLLVLCPAFKGRAEFSNLTVKKIPKHVLHRCDWDNKKYNEQIARLTQAPAKPGQQALTF